MQSNNMLLHHNFYTSNVINLSEMVICDLVENI